MTRKRTGKNNCNSALGGGIKNMVLCRTKHYYLVFVSRGFCFLEYESHKAASLAKRRLETGRVKVWSCDIIVDWADPQEEPDEGTMSQVF